MSDQTNAPTTTTTETTAPAKPKQRTRKATVPHSSAIAAYAKAKNIDEVRAGKQFRAVLRANADTYKKNGGKTHAKNSPWGDHPRKALAALFPTVPTFKG